MKCKLCGSENVKIIYKGKIRDGGLGKYTSEDREMHQCDECGVIWHDKLNPDLREYYESTEYRDSLEGSSSAEDFYRLHDKETLDKLQYTGTNIYRNKVVADIGCGCGAFLDFIQGVASTVIAVEPSEVYRKIMNKKGYQTYAYTRVAKDEWENKIDIITSFDVIEHVDDPKEFLMDIYDLLSVDEGGKAIIGTPTDAPVMRNLLGEIYEKKLLFSTQHLWIFSESNLKMLAEQVGFKKVEIKYFQRYGIGNLLGWLREKQPCSDLKNVLIMDILDSMYKSECSVNKKADYIVMYLEK